MDKTSLYDWHQLNSNNIIPFSGYLLPVYYTSIVDEHLSVRKKAGLFDVSHMGELIVSGKESEKFIQLVTVNDISKLNYSIQLFASSNYPDVRNHLNKYISKSDYIYKKEDFFTIILIVKQIYIKRSLN